MGKKNKGKKKKTGNKKPVAAAPASAEPKVENVEETVAAVESGEPTSRNSTVEVAEKNSMASSEEAVDGVVDRQQDAAQGVKDDETSPAEVSQAIEAEPNNETGVDVFSGVKKPTGEMITTGETMNKESLSAGASNNDGGGISAEDPNTQTPEQNSEDTKEETISQQQENAPVVTESSSGADGGTVPDLKSGENDVNDCVNSKVEEKQEIVSVKAEPKDSKSNADVVQNSEISTGGKELDYAIIMDTEDISEKEQEIAPVEEEEEFTAAEHLVNLHQPKDMCEADNKSLDEFDLFDDEPEERPSKPILAAALKASEQLKAEDNGTAHLTGLHQPRDRCDKDNKSLDEFDLFDDEPEERPSKPILAAALKAAEQLKAEDSGTLHLAELHQPKDLCEADNKSLDEFDLFDDEPEERPSKPMLAAALKASEQLKGDSSTDNANKKEQSGQKGDTSALSGSEESKVGGGNPVDTESSVAESAENVVEENKQEQNETSVPKDDILNKEREEVKEKEMTEKNNSLDDANKAPVIKEGIVSEPTSMGVNINVEASTVQDAEKDKTPSEVGEKLSVAFQTPPPIQKNYKRPQGGRASGTVASGFQSPAVSKRQSMQSARERELEELRQRGLASNSVDTKYIKFEKMSPEGGKCPDPDSDSLVLSQTKWRNDNQRKGGDNRVVYEREQLSSESTEDGPKEIGPNKEFPFVFRLVYAKDAEEPDEEICNNAAANIVPKTLVGKDKVTYNPNYPPVVSSIELDNDFHESEQVRYIIRGKIPVFAEDGYDSPPAKSSKSSRRKSKKKSKSKSSEQRRLSKEFSGAGNSKGEEGTAADETEVRNSNASAEEGRRREEQPTPISELSDERQTEDSTSVSNKAVIPNSSAEPDPSWEPSAVENVTKDAPISGSNEVTKESPVEATPSIAPSVVEKAAEDDIIPSSDEVAKQKANGDFFRPSPSKKPPSQETLAKRQSAKDMELEALRQRGLAKKENKTFSQLEQESAVEKAAYEAEKRDLETRKANTSEYRYSGNAHINPKDALYMSQTKMKNEYRQKERETLLQNQRHSHSSESALLYAKPMNSLPRNVQPPKLEGNDRRSSASKRLQELEEIRKQGVSKKTAQQFTDFEKMSAEDKAAQDAAREDLERRKANTSEYRFSGNAQINSHDVMYLSQTKLKNEARRKERETMLQNQRHSHSSESALLQATIVNPNIMPRQNSLPRNVKPPNLDEQENRLSVTNSKELQELEELRQQGTARKSAQEFAEIEKKSNEDKVAQDAATKDLEERKAKTSEFKHNPNQEISPVDNLYLAHHKWKNETRKQDREALGIYDKKPDHIIDDDDGDEKQSPTFIIAREHPGSDIPKKEGPEEQLPELAACGCEQCVIS